MHSSNQSRFPLWLLCLLLFAVLVIFFLIRIPIMLSSGNSADVTVPDIPEERTLDTSDELLPETADDMQLVPADEALIVEEPAAEPVVDIEPEPTPEPAPAVHIHSYVNGVCSECGAKPEFITDFLPAEFYQENAHAGTVTLHQYEITAYANYGQGTVSKSFNIYLPYGYDETRPYNVLVLVHGYDGNQDSWLNTVYDYGEIQMCGRILFDNMFDKGVCEPCIIITPVTETNQIQGLTAGIYQLQEELREYILPYVAEHYSTFSADGSLESLHAARDHFALGGLSNGALFTYEGGMRYDFDLFGSYAAFSGNGEPWKTISMIQSNEDFARLPVNCYFTGAGSLNDWQQHYTEIGYEYFVENDPRFTDGVNSWRVDVNGEHEWKVWFTDIYNALPLLFQNIE
ncbi:MAG: hypothetical protein IJV40_08575 [Oscillospiraceae bacterium]|nr:hypothetical protein [Oscillospiraceae bacterium]